MLLLASPAPWAERDIPDVEESGVPGQPLHQLVSDDVERRHRGVVVRPEPGLASQQARMRDCLRMASRRVARQQQCQILHAGPACRSRCSSGMSAHPSEIRVRVVASKPNTTAAPGDSGGWSQFTRTTIHTISRRSVRPSCRARTRPCRTRTAPHHTRNATTIGTGRHACCRRWEERSEVERARALHIR